MKKLFLTFGIVAMTVSAASAQTVMNNYDNEQLGTYERVTKSGPYLTGRFFDNMFIGIGGGVNMYDYSGGVKTAKLGDRLAPSVDVYIGKWITPSVGLRIGYNGIQTKSVNPAQPFIAGEKDKLRKFNTMFIHGDVMWNISNTIGGYNEHRFWDLVPFVGVGYARAWEDGLNQNKIAANIGLLNNFRLGNTIDLTLEARWMLVDDGFDGFAANNKFENLYSLTAGLTFKFGPKGGFKRPYSAPADYTSYERRVSSLESDLQREKATIDRLNRELEAEKNKIKTTIQVEKVFTPVTISSFFGIGNGTPTEKEVVNLKAVADAMKAQPQAKFNVTGYADAGTGSAARNMELSQARANNVANILVNTYNVNRSQLNITGKGGVTRNPNKPTLDRVVVID